MKNVAETIFDKVYDELNFKEAGFADLNSRVDSLIKEVIEENEGKLDGQQLESLIGSSAKAIAEAQRGGYKLGLKHATRFIFSILVG